MKVGWKMRVERHWKSANDNLCCTTRNDCKRDMKKNLSLLARTQAAEQMQIPNRTSLSDNPQYDAFFSFEQTVYVFTHGWG